MGISRPLSVGILAGMMAGLVLSSPAGALEVGQKAPDFKLDASNGQAVQLVDLLGKGPVVIYTFIQALGGVGTKEITGFEASRANFEAAGAQVVGVSVDVQNTLIAFAKTNNITHLLLSDFRRQMLPAYGAVITDEKSPMFRYGQRAYFILDKTGTVKWVKILDNPLDILQPAEVLAALKQAGV